MKSETFIDTELRLVSEAHRAGKLAEAEAKIDTLLISHRERADVRAIKGAIQISRGDPAGGLESLLESIRLQPDVPEILFRTAFTAVQLSRFQEAEALARRLTQIESLNGRAFFLLANALRGLDRIAEALEAIDRSLELNPHDTDSLVIKARLLKQRGMHYLAADFYRAAMSVKPCPPAALDLAQMYLRENRPEEALETLQQAFPALRVEHRPHLLVAEALTQLGRFDDAAVHWRQALTVGNKPDVVVQAQAKAEVAAGRFEAVEEILIDAIEAGVAPVACFAILTTSRKLQPDDRPLIESMERIVRSGTLSPFEASDLNYALGKAFDDLRDYERAIQFFDEANRICFELYPSRQNFDACALSAFNDFIIETFTAEYVNQLSKDGSQSELPLFIVGLMRSGTTLTESILNAHSKIKARGELLFWPERGIELFRPISGGFGFNDKLARRFADDYLKEIEPADGDIRHVTGKTPGNIDVAGMFLGIFRNSKMIHLLRHPVDNLLSMWMTPMGPQVSRVSSRKNLAFTYREHMRLHQHWKEALPSERYATYKYEDLTSKPHETISELLDFLGLERETACFEPHRTSRTVLTPSAYQVRQPIHRDSQARWKNYEPWLGEFSELLE